MENPTQNKKYAQKKKGRKRDNYEESKQPYSVVC